MTPQRLAEAMIIFSRYGPQPDVIAESSLISGKLYAGPDPKIVTESDRKRLKELGWTGSGYGWVDSSKEQGFMLFL